MAKFRWLYSSTGNFLRHYREVNAVFPLTKYKKLNSPFGYTSLANFLQCRNCCAIPRNLRLLIVHCSLSNLVVLQVYIDVFDEPERDEKGDGAKHKEENKTDQDCPTNELCCLHST